MKAYLALQNGSVFEGTAIGKIGTALGETVFNTGMTGYQEVLTDPSYFGQIVTMTYPLIGNYGINLEDGESRKSWVRGFVVRELDEEPSNFRCRQTLGSYLEEQNVVGIADIDTRALTRILRDNGTLNGAILSEADFENRDRILAQVSSYQIKDSVQSVTAAKPKHYAPEHPRYKVALMDYGYKRNILRNLMLRDCEVWVLPADTKTEEVLAGGYDGVMLSNGPGDPAENLAIIGELKKLLHSGLPVFGICLGHQLTALAMGARTEKLQYGHRGANHPVKDVVRGRTYITSQNHGYAVVADSVDPEIAQISHINMNDGTVEGIAYHGLPVFTVQFHPEASPGPMNTAYLFDRFTNMMDKGVQ